MKPGGPWSVKGIEPEVRETAKSAARRAGKTLGEWLNQVIMETGQELDTADILRNSEAWADLQAKAPWSEVVDDLAQKFEASEERHNALLKNIDLAIGGLAEKLNQRGAAEADRQLDPEDFREVSERIDELETQSKRALSKDDLVTVEKAMSNVALVLDASEKRQGEKIHAVDSSLGDIHLRLDDAEKRLDEALATLEAGSQSGQEADAQTDILNTISDDMARLDDRLRDTHDRSEQALENVHRNISSIITRLDESDTLTNDALISSIARTETSLTDVTNRLGAIEAHENGSQNHLEARLANVTQQIDKARADQQATLDEIRSSLAALSDRMTDLEKSAEDVSARLPEPIEEDVKPTAASEPAAEEDSPPAELETFDQEATNGAEESNDDAEEAPTGVAFDRAEFEELLLGKGYAKASAEPAPYKPVDGTEGWAEAVLKSVEESENQPLGPSDTDRDDASAPEDTPAEAESDVDALDTLELTERVDDEDDGSDNLSIAEKLQGLREEFVSQSPEDEEHFRGSLRELVTRDEKSKSRRPYYIVAGGLIGLALLLVGVVVFTGSDKELVVSGQQPSLVDNITAVITGLFAKPEDTAPALDSQDLPVVDAEIAEPQGAIEPETSEPEGGATSEILESNLLEVPAAPTFGTEDAPVEQEISNSSVGSPTASFLIPAEFDATGGLIQAAQNGDAKAQFALASAYSAGTLLDVNEAQATQWYLAAAEQGLAIAQYAIGSRYERGIAIPRDGATAVDWYVKAAVGGNRKAMHNLAVAYAKGEHVEQDLVSAARWFEEAARLGLADSQFNLGLLYERGIGVERDLAEAFKWFSIAAQSGDRTAMQNAETLEAKLAEDDLRFVELYLKTWHAAQTDPIANGRFDISPVAYINNDNRIELAHVQKMLTSLGFNLASVDGVVDETTTQAIRDYQELLGMPVTGEVSDELIGQLESAAY